jgi:hypothetical protein
MTDHTNPADPAARETLDPPPAGSDATRDPQSALSTGSAPTLPTSFGRFEVRDFLGEGSFGTVYRAYDPQLDREVALKVAKPGAAPPERFRREAKASANLRHPNIVPLFEAGEINGHLYFASAFIAGMTLEDRLHERGATLPPREAAEIARKLADALAYAHGQGVIHRDVKSANVMLDAQGEPHLLDFGLALRSEGAERMTQDGKVLGTPAYLAPEAARGDRDPWSQATDQYALGIVLYELLTGHTPFAGPIPVVLHLHQTREPEPPSKVNPAVPRDLEAVCLKCLEKDPRQRYATVKELADDLERLFSGQPIQARPLNLLLRLRWWCCHHDRIRDAGYFSVWLMIVVTAWALCGLAVHAAGAAARGSHWPLENSPIPSKADLAVIHFVGVLGGLFLPLFFIGLGAIQGKVASLWIGLVFSVAGLSLMLGYLIGMDGLLWLIDLSELCANQPVRFFAFGFPVILFGLVVAAYCIALFAYYHGWGDLTKCRG